ncbi:MAG: ATP-binding protein [Candidatus Heimdallarchaeota archaeon]
MRVKRIKVDKYGPLNNLDLSLNPGINVIYGPNESGKSLTMDFLLKKLSKKQKAEYKRKDRVKEKPEGYIIFHDTKDIKLEPNQCLTDFLPKIKDADVCRIFVMKDSDLNIPDGKYYSDITDRLTGLRTDDIDKISKKILEYGFLTIKTKELVDTSKSDNLNSRVEAANTLRNEVSKYIRKIEKDNLQVLEGEIFTYNIKLKRVEEDLKKQKVAKQIHEFKKNKDAIEEIEFCKGKIEKLPEADFLNSLKVKLSEYITNETSYQNFSKISKFSKWGIIPSFLFCFVFWLVWIFTTQPIIGIFTPIMTSFFLLSYSILWFIAYNRMKSQNELRTEIIDNGKKMGVEEETIEVIGELLESNLESIDDYNEKITENYGALKRSLDLIVDSEKVIEQAEKKLLEIEGKIDLKLKTKYKQSKVNDLEQSINKLRDTISSKEGDLEQHNEKLLEFSRSLSTLNISSSLNDEFDLHIENSDSLSVLIKRLENFINFIENRATTCRNALEIFDTISIEEKAKINQLFDEDSVSIGLFKEMTNGKYDDIVFMSESGKIFVKKSSGGEISAEDLSEGAYDQLYFAIRVDLAQRILENNSGFLIMDDIFLSFDTDRLTEAFDILKKLKDMDWQIIYFTAKDEICDLFTKVTGNDPFKLTPLI